MKLVAFGEPMIELAERLDNNGIPVFVAGFGGDTSNVSIAAARQGLSVTYLTALGKDDFGNDFLELYRKENVNTDHIYIDANHHTGLYFIHYSEQGHAFSYLRKDSAASFYNASMLPQKVIEQAECFYTSGITQAISQTCCDASFKAIAVAEAAGVLTVYDPNLRLKLWDLERAKAIIHHTALMVDIFMPSLEDAQSLTSLTTKEEILDYYHNLGVKTIILKLGSKGVYLSSEEYYVHVEPHQVNVIDQTGAGDTFNGAFLAKYLESKDLLESVKYANAAAALSTQGVGAVMPIPNAQKVEQILNVTK